MSNTADLRLGKHGNAGSLNQDGLRGGIKREDAEKAGFGTIFDAFDNGNQVLTDDEIQSIQTQVQQYAKHGKNSVFSEKEAQKFIEEFNKNENNKNKLNDIDAKKLFDFLQFVESKAKSVISSVVDDNNAVVTKFRNSDGNEVTETFNQTTKVAEQVVSANGQQIRTALKGGTKLSETTTDETTGNTTVVEYEADGTTVKSKVIEEKSPDKKTTKKTTITYTNGKESVETVETDDTEEVYTYQNGKRQLSKKVEGKTTADKKTTTYQYTTNGRIETVEDKNGKTVVEYRGNNQVITTKDGITTDVTTTANGRTEKITNSSNSNITTNIYSKDNKLIEQQKVVGGKTYTVKYDENGNTTGIVVQYGENAAIIAKKFGCTKAELLAANGKKAGQDFQAGEIIVVPKKLEADTKALKGRKDQQGALRDKAVADERARKIAQERARQKAIAQQRAKNLDAQYRQLGLKDYKRAGEKFTYGKETYTIVGTLNNRARLLVKDSKGNLHVASHDKKILKETYVQKTNFYDRTKKVTLKGGKTVAVVGSRKDGHGRYYAVDEKGNYIVVSGGSKKGEFGDRVILNNSYVSAQDARDMYMTQLKNEKDAKRKQALQESNRAISNNSVTRFKGKDGRVWYFDANGRAVNMAKHEAAAIVKELDDSADGWFFGLGTDEDKLTQANNKIVDPAVLAEINKHYETKGYQAEGDYKSAYEAFLGSEVQLHEIYELNADLVSNGAILDQTRRDEIILTNLTTYGDKSANRNKGLRAVSSRTDYHNLQSSLAKYNKDQGYTQHIKGQDALQTTLYNITDGDVKEIEAANLALIQGNERAAAEQSIYAQQDLMQQLIFADAGLEYDPENSSQNAFLSQDDITRIRAEIGFMYAAKGDKQNAYRSHDLSVYQMINNLQGVDGTKIDVAKDATTADLMITGYGTYTNEEIANQVIIALQNSIDKYKETEDDLTNPYMDASNAPAVAARSHQSAEDYASTALALLQNYEILELVKQKLGVETYNQMISKIHHETEGNINFNNLVLYKSSAQELTQSEIDSNLSFVNQYKSQIMSLQNSHLSNVFDEGFKMSFVNDIRQNMFMGTTRDDMSNQYTIATSNIHKLELAARGQLVDENGKSVTFEEAVQKLTGKTVEQLQTFNQTYLRHQQYGEMGLDITVGLATMVIPIPGLGVGKTVQVAGQTYKVIKVVNAATNEYKVVKLATNAVQAGLKVETAQYVMDKTNLSTSVSGNTLERRGAVENKSQEVGTYAAVGTFIGGGTSIITQNMNTAGRIVTNVAGYGADVSAASLITQHFHGGEFMDNIRIINEDGSINTAGVLNTTMTSLGYIHGLGIRPAHNNVHPTPSVQPHVEVKPETVLQRITKNNPAPRSVGKLNDTNFASLKNDVEAELKKITTVEGAEQLKERIGVLQNRKQRRAIEGMIEQRKIEIETGVTPSREPVAAERVQEKVEESVDLDVEGRVEHEAEGRVELEAEGRVEHEAEGRVEHEAEGRVEHEAEGRVKPEVEGKVVPTEDPTPAPKSEQDAFIERLGADKAELRKQYSEMSNDELVAEYQRLKNYENDGRKYLRKTGEDGTGYFINSHDCTAQKTMINDILTERGLKLKRTNNNGTEYSYERVNDTPAPRADEPASNSRAEKVDEAAVQKEKFQKLYNELSPEAKAKYDGLSKKISKLDKVDKATYKEIKKEISEAFENSDIKRQLGSELNKKMLEMKNAEIKNSVVKSIVEALPEQMQVKFHLYSEKISKLTDLTKTRYKQYKEEITTAFKDSRICKYLIEKLKDKYKESSKILKDNEKIQSLISKLSPDLKAAYHKLENWIAHLQEKGADKYSAIQYNLLKNEIISKFYKNPQLEGQLLYMLNNKVSPHNKPVEQVTPKPATDSSVGEIHQSERMGNDGTSRDSTPLVSREELVEEMANF